MKGFYLTIIFLILALSPLWSADYSEYYGSLTGINFLTDDENTGTTVFPVLKIPSGGRAISMGTAQTAVAIDATSIMYNPAVSSKLDLTALSFIHNDWIADSSIESLLFTMRFNKLGIGAGIKLIYLPFTAYNDWGLAVSNGFPLEGVLTLNASYNFLKNFYFDGLATGISLKTAYRHIPDEIYSNQSSIAFMIDAGVYTGFDFLKFYVSRDTNFSVGLALKNIGFETLGESLPGEFSAGINYSPVRPVSIAIDFNLPINLLGEPAERWYLSCGFNANVTTFFAFQGGFNYMGANPRFSLGSTINLKDVEFNLSYTYDLTSSSKNIDRFTIEAKLKLGDEGRYAKQQKVDELYIAGLDAYAEGELKKAIAFWEAALKIDESFTPAEEFLESTKIRVELEEQIESFNSL